jgi:hypothetical protein
MEALALHRDTTFPSILMALHRPRWHHKIDNKATKEKEAHKLTCLSQPFHPTSHRIAASCCIIKA